MLVLKTLQKHLTGFDNLIAFLNSDGESSV